MRLRVETQRLCAIERGAIGDGASGGAVAVDSVAASAENCHILSRDPRSAGQSELLIASANASVADLYCDFSARDQANALRFSS